MRDLHVDARACARAHAAAVDGLAVATHRHLCRRGRRALILDPEGDGLALSDNAEPWSGHEHHAPVALVLVTGDQRMDRRSKAERSGLARHVMDATVGDEENAGHPIVRYVSKRGAECREQPRTVGLPVGLSRLDKAHLEVCDAPQALGDGGARGLGLLQTIAKFLARALVDDHDGDRSQGIPIFARDRGIGESEHEQGKRNGAHQGATAAPEHDQQGNHEGDGDRRPHDAGRNERVE